MAMTGTGLRDAIKAAREGVEGLPDEPTQDDVQAYTERLELAVWSALIEYIQNNAEVVGDVDAGIVVEDLSDVEIGETRAGTNVINGTIT